MRAFAVAWPDEDFVQGVLAQLPWYTHLALLEKVETLEERRWYAQKAIEHGWSRNVLVLQIDAQAMKRTGAAVTNFQARLPKPHSDLARESLKDPYRLDFLGLGEDAQERVVEAALVQHITKFLLELGAGSRSWGVSACSMSAATSSSSTFSSTTCGCVAMWWSS